MKGIINELKALVSKMQEIMHDCDSYDEAMNSITFLDLETSKLVFGILGKMEGLLLALTEFSDQNEKGTNRKEFKEPEED